MSGSLLDVILSVYGLISYFHCLVDEEPGDLVVFLPAVGFFSPNFGNASS